MQRTDTDHLHLARAIELAERGRGQVSPNPLVGAVLVRDGEVLGEGWHDRLRRPARRGRGDPRRRRRRPARRDALRLARALLPPGPARRRAPTRSSRPASAASSSPRDDPTEKATGRGLGHPARRGRRGRRRRRRARRARARLVNQAFRKHARTGPPVGALQVGDDARRQGRHARPATRSGSPARRAASCAHRWRAEVDAVAVGIGTALADDPQLTARVDGVHRQPRRVVFDSTARLPLDSQARRARRREVPLTVVVSRAAPRAATEALEMAGAEVIVATGEQRARARPLRARPARRARRAGHVDPARGRPAPGGRVPRRRRDRRGPPVHRAARCSAAARRATRSRARASSGSPTRCAR